MTYSAAIFGPYFVLFLVVSVVAQEVPDEPTEVDEGTIATLNATDFDSLNATLEERPSKCKEILQGIVDESVNSTRPLIEEHVLNATKNLLTDEFIPEVTLQFDSKVATAENRVTQTVEGLISGLAQKVSGLEQSMASKDTEISQLKQQFGGLELSIASKDTEISQLKQRFEESIASKGTEIGQLKQRFEESIASKDTEISQLKQRLNVLDTKVIFGAVRTRIGNFRGPITYDNLVINLGEGFDIGSGMFVVPTSGTYRLSVSAQTGSGKYDISVVYVLKNGSHIFSIGDGNKKDDMNNVSYTWLMKLSKNDKINLSSGNHLYTDSSNPVTFTGELIYI